MNSILFCAGHCDINTDDCLRVTQQAVTREHVEKSTLYTTDVIFKTDVLFVRYVRTVQTRRISKRVENPACSRISVMFLFHVTITTTFAEPS